jgi:hypothetical protein
MLFRDIVCLAKIGSKVVEFDCTGDHRFANRLPITQTNCLSGPSFVEIPVQVIVLLLFRILTVPRVQPRDQGTPRRCAD